MLSGLPIDDESGQIFSLVDKPPVIGQQPMSGSHPICVWLLSVTNACLPERKPIVYLQPL
jgi:hypothetical protein